MDCPNLLSYRLEKVHTMGNKTLFCDAEYVFHDAVYIFRIAEYIFRIAE